MAKPVLAGVPVGVSVLFEFADELKRLLVANEKLGFEESRGALNAEKPAAY